MSMITITINSKELIDALCDRFDLKWSAGMLEDEKQLWYELFEFIVDERLFNADRFSIAGIVDDAYTAEFECITRDDYINEYGVDPEYDQDGRVFVSSDDLCIISRENRF